MLYYKILAIKFVYNIKVCILKLKKYRTNRSLCDEIYIEMV